jgi:undecaprenyl-diphosphatase
MVAHRAEPVTTLAKVLTTIGSQTVLVPVVTVLALVLLWRRRFVPAVSLVGVWGGAILLYSLGKYFVGRPRPPAGLWLVQVGGTSFPSGHATQSLATFVALAVVVAHWLRRAPWPGVAVAVVLAAGVGWSRVYLGVHWATDVAAGWLLAAGWLAVVLGYERAYSSAACGSNSNASNGSSPRTSAS